MKQAIKLGILLVASLFLISCGRSSPEERIADHIENVGEIFSDNMDDPEDGVDELLDYYDDNFSDIVMAVADGIVEIHESSEKKTRVRKMADEILKAVKNIQGPAMKFGQKVDSKDREFQNKLQRKMMLKFGEYAELEDVFEDIERDFGRSFR